MKLNKKNINIISKKEKKKILLELKNYENKKSVIIEALKIIQKKRNWISNSLIIKIANILKVSIIEVEEIATFYSQIFRKPVGKYIIRFCDSVVCYINGCKKIKKQLIKCLNIKPSETTLDKRFTLLPISCLGKCDKGPVIMINKDIYTYLIPKKIKFILKKYK